MSKIVLLAARPEFTEQLCEIIQGAHKLVVVDSLDDALAHLDRIRFEIALIDEDFDGPGSGWVLAEQVRRQRGNETKIIVMGKGRKQDYWQCNELDGLFDWVMSYPVSDDELLSELDRRWPLTN